VIDVYAYVADGRLDVADANAGTRRRPSTPQLAAYNARVSALKLSKRFPLDKVALKKRAGAA
jgi:hypothetical protein